VSLTPARFNSAARVAGLVRRFLEQGCTVEIEHLGAFGPDREGGYVFRPARTPRIFVSYVEEDLARVERVYARLKRSGYKPWMDRHCLLPGQNWPRAIGRAIELSDFFLACLSPRSVSKRGVFQSEMRWALDCARRLPLDDVFFIPVRLEECAVPSRIQQSLQYIDLFPDFEAGMKRVQEMMESELARRRAA
jgi:hypothetical protein